MRAQASDATVATEAAGCETAANPRRHQPRSGVPPPSISKSLATAVSVRRTVGTVAALGTAVRDRHAPAAAACGG